MTVQEKLQLILKLSDLTQQQLADRLGVTFSALNRWINSKATPRQKAQIRIDALYKEYSGEKLIPENLLAAKKDLLVQRKKGHKNILKEILNSPDIRDQFFLSLTYNSNKIEGSTLSENETAAILFQNAALPNKTLTEQLEAKNHQAALIYLLDHLSEGTVINEKLILKLHGILMNAIRTDAGTYRNHGVRIMGAFIPTANYVKIPQLMTNLIRRINQNSKDNIRHISKIHAEFEQIHPFGDGNGRVGRLIMLAMTLNKNLAPAVILQEKKRLYITYLNKAQMQDDSTLLEDFICDAIETGFDILDRKLT